jgi:hypothetical protein
VTRKQKRLIRAGVGTAASLAVASAVTFPTPPAFFLVGVNGTSTEEEVRKVAQKYGVHFRCGPFNRDANGQLVGRVSRKYADCLQIWKKQGDKYILYYEPQSPSPVWVILRWFIFWALLVPIAAMLIII